MQSILLRQVTVLDRHSPHHTQVRDVMLAEGHIVQIVERLNDSFGGEIVECRGQYLSRGFCDTWVQVMDPGFEQRETLGQLAATARAGGYTDLLCMPNTNPVIDNAEVLTALRSRAAALQHLVTLHFAGAVSVGTLGKDLAELGLMAEAGALAFSDGPLGVQDAGLIARALQYASPFGLAIHQLPHDTVLAAKGQANESPIVAALGLRGIPALAEEMRVARDLSLVAYAGGSLHFSGITTRGAISLIAQAKAAGLSVTASTTPAALALDDSVLAGFDSRFKVLPPLRETADVHACRDALATGVLDGVASHHTATTLEDKDQEFELASFGMPSLPYAFALCNSFLAKALSPEQIVDRLTHFPRVLLGLAPEPIATGNSASLNLIDATAPFSHPSGTAGKLNPYRELPLLGVIRPLG